MYFLINISLTYMSGFLYFLYDILSERKNSTTNKLYNQILSFRIKVSARMFLHSSENLHKLCSDKYKAFDVLRNFYFRYHTSFIMFL